jgi:hypothetical protein
MLLMQNLQHYECIPCFMMGDTSLRHAVWRAGELGQPRSSGDAPNVLRGGSSGRAIARRSSRLLYKRVPSEGRELSLTLVVLGVVGWLLGLLFVLVLMRMANDQDRAARHEQKRIDRFPM